MKRFLLATTVLVGSAGFAAAEVSVSGDARMGVVYDDFFTGDELAFDSRARVTFTLTGETDGGLSFGASFRADNANTTTSRVVTPSAACLDAANDEIEALNCFVSNTSRGAIDGTSGTVFLSGAFGTLSMGDTSSAAENAVGDLDEIGYTGFSSFGGVVLQGGTFDGELGNEFAYVSTGDDEMALYEYAAGDVTLYASVGQPGDGTASYSLAARYQTDQFAISLGYEDLEDEATQVIGGVSGTFSGVTVTAIYGAISGRGAVLDVDQYGLSASYTLDVTTIDGFWRETSVSDGTDISAYGIGATYDLGGGAAIEGGIGRIDDGIDANTIADLGVTFEF